MILQSVIESVALYYNLSLVGGSILQSVIEPVALYYKLSLVGGIVLQSVVESMALYYKLSLVGGIVVQFVIKSVGLDTKGFEISTVHARGHFMMWEEYLYQKCREGEHGA